jgi:hypothetical protein
MKQFETVFQRDATKSEQAASLAKAWTCALGLWYKKGPHNAKKPDIWSNLLCAFLDDKANPGSKKDMFLEMKSLNAIEGATVTTNEHHHLDLILNKACWLEDDNPDAITRNAVLNSRQRLVLKLFYTRAMDYQFDFEPDIDGNINTITPKRRKDMILANMSFDFKPRT